MDDRTMINPRLRESVPTLVNREYADEISRRSGTDGPAPGTVLKGAAEYTVLRKMETVSGEADLYLCSFGENGTAVAKIYRRENPLKPGVDEALKSIRSPFVARVYDVFQWNGRTAAVLQYFRNGSLAGRRFSFGDLKKFVIPGVNEGLRALHERGLIHKDLKPSNVMLGDDGESVAIIDFGISSMLEEGNTVLLTRTGMTPAYSAPELKGGVATLEADYYSFGVTLYELFCGGTPYENFSEAEILRSVSTQRIPFPKNVPSELRKLIAALTYIDITHRDEKSNPNRRWTYKEVNAWLRGEPLPSPGGYDAGAMDPFVFQGKTFTRLPDLIEAMGLNWEAGKKALYHGTLADHIRETEPELYELCAGALRQASESGGKDDIVFFRFLYEASPGLRAVYWKGRRFAALPSFGREMLEALWKGDASQYPLYDSLLSEGVLSAYVSARDPENGPLLNAVRGVEALWASRRSAKEDVRFAYYMLAYLLSGRLILRIEDAEIGTVGELAELLQKRLEVSVKDLTALTHRLIGPGGRLDVQLEAWLTALGREADVARWKELLQIGGSGV